MVVEEGSDDLGRMDTEAGLGSGAAFVVEGGGLVRDVASGILLESISGI